MQTKTTIAIAVALIATLMGAVLWIGRLRQEAKIKATLNRGRNIVYLLSKENTTPTNPKFKGPSPDALLHMDWKSSTEYFSYVVAEGLLSLDFRFFSAVNLPPATGGKLEPENNAWCMNASHGTNAPGHVPALFTRNMYFTVADGSVKATLSPEQPFGKGGAAVVLWNGTCLHVRSRDLDALTRNLSAEHVQNILRP